jgi:hypothetical protein
LFAPDVELSTVLEKVIVSAVVVIVLLAAVPVIVTAPV